MLVCYEFHLLANSQASESVCCRLLKRVSFAMQGENGRFAKFFTTTFARTHVIRAAEADRLRFAATSASRADRLVSARIRIRAPAISAYCELLLPEISKLVRLSSRSGYGAAHRRYPEETARLGSGGLRCRRGCRSFARLRQLGGCRCDSLHEQDRLELCAKSSERKREIAQRDARTFSALAAHFSDPHAVGRRFDC